jgi:uncharacterized protein DUF6455
MGFIDKLAQSGDLVNGMADRLGINIADRLASNPELEAIRLRAAIARCSHCSNQNDCTNLQNRTTRLDQTPDYCQNKDVFSGVRRI